VNATATEPSKAVPVFQLLLQYARERYELYRARAYGPRLQRQAPPRAGAKIEVCGESAGSGEGRSAHWLRMGPQGSRGRRNGRRTTVGAGVEPLTMGRPTMGRPSRVGAAFTRREQRRSDEVRAVPEALSLGSAASRPGRLSAAYERTVRGSPKCSKRAVSANQVIAAAASRSSVSTSRPAGLAIPVCASGV
jgi:hypothetical protein